MQLLLFLTQAMNYILPSFGLALGRLLRSLSTSLIFFATSFPVWGTLRSRRWAGCYLQQTAYRMAAVKHCRKPFSKVGLQACLLHHHQH